MRFRALWGLVLKEFLVIFVGQGTYRVATTNSEPETLNPKA